jgi:DHA1 family multidrug resistance protein-like MFS transporter
MENWKKTFYACSAAQLLATCGFSFVFPFLPFFIRRLGIHQDADVSEWSGIMMSATGLTLAVFAPIWGMASDRFGRKSMVLRATFGGAVVIGLMGFVTNVHQLLALRILQGAVTGTVPAAIALVASVAPARRAGHVLGMMQATVFIGNSLGPFLGGVVAAHFGMRASFFVAAALLFAGALLVQFAAHENFTPAPRMAGSKNSFGALLATPAFLVVLTLFFQVHFANALPRPIFPLYIESLLDLPVDPAEATGIIWALNAAAAAVAAHTLGRYADIWGHRKTIFVCAMLGGLMVLPQAFVRNVPQLAVFSILFSAAAAGILPAANALIRRVTPRSNLGKAYGISSSVCALGFGIGPVTGGYLAAQVGYRKPFLLSGALLMLVGVSAMLLIRKLPPAPVEESEETEVVPPGDPPR